jgi:hypothetical protein
MYVFILSSWKGNVCKREHMLWSACSLMGDMCRPWHIQFNPKIEPWMGFILHSTVSCLNGGELCVCVCMPHAALGWEAYDVFLESRFTSVEPSRSLCLTSTLIELCHHISNVSRAYWLLQSSFLYPNYLWIVACLCVLSELTSGCGCYPHLGEIGLKTG